MVSNGFEEGLRNSNLGCSGITQAFVIFTIFESPGIFLFPNLEQLHLTSLEYTL